jgi:dTDP-glucose pyrophosphorylase
MSLHNDFLPMTSVRSGLLRKLPSPCSQWGLNPQYAVQPNPDGLAQEINLAEKPCQPKSSDAVIGRYFYYNHEVELAKTLKPSSCGELDISDLNRVYLEQVASCLKDFVER